MLARMTPHSEPPCCSLENANFVGKECKEIGEPKGEEHLSGMQQRRLCPQGVGPDRVLFVY